MPAPNACPVCGTEGGHKPTFTDRTLILRCRACGEIVREFPPLMVTDEAFASLNPEE